MVCKDHRALLLQQVKLIVQPRQKRKAMARTAEPGSKIYSTARFFRVDQSVVSRWINDCKIWNQLMTLWVHLFLKRILAAEKAPQHEVKHFAQDGPDVSRNMHPIILTVNPMRIWNRRSRDTGISATPSSRLAVKSLPQPTRGFERTLERGTSSKAILFLRRP